MFLLSPAIFLYFRDSIGISYCLLLFVTCHYSKLISVNHINSFNYSINLRVLFFALSTHSLSPSHSLTHSLIHCHPEGCHARWTLSFRWPRDGLRWLKSTFRGIRNHSKVSNISDIAKCGYFHSARGEYSVLAQYWQPNTSSVLSTKSIVRQYGEDNFVITSKQPSNII